jgi:tRNA (cytidine/uridine-2'-O-)-methyltransferase
MEGFLQAQMKVVLVEPEIPPNTGNVARLCAATGAQLHLIEPFGFEFDDRTLKRAGMDYWHYVQWQRWPDWGAFAAQLPPTARLWLVESAGPRHYAEVTYSNEDYLVFGRETAGLPKALLARYSHGWIRIPMFNSQARSLNLSNCVALVLYEALRQLGFPAEVGRQCGLG